MATRFFKRLLEDASSLPSFHVSPLKPCFKIYSWARPSVRSFNKSPGHLRTVPAAKISRISNPASPAAKIRTGSIRLLRISKLLSEAQIELPVGIEARHDSVSDCRADHA